MSCCKFERESYKYDTATPRLLDLQATHFLLNTSVLTTQADANITVTVVYANSNTIIRLWPLVTSRCCSVDHPQKAGGKDAVHEEYHANMRSVEKQGSGLHKYDFSIWVAPGEKLSLTPNAPVGSDLLFYPPTATFTLYVLAFLVSVNVFGFSLTRYLRDI